MADHHNDPLHWVDAELQRLESFCVRRRLITRTARKLLKLILNLNGRHTGRIRQAKQLQRDDYLGLAADPRLIARAHEAALREGWGAGGESAYHGSLADSS